MEMNGHLDPVPHAQRAGGPCRSMPVLYRASSSIGVGRTSLRLAQAARRCDPERACVAIMTCHRLCRLRREMWQHWEEGESGPAAVARPQPQQTQAPPACHTCQRLLHAFTHTHRGRRRVARLCITAALWGRRWSPSHLDLQRQKAPPRPADGERSAEFGDVIVRCLPGCYLGTSICDSRASCVAAGAAPAARNVGHRERNKLPRGRARRAGLAG